MHAVATSTEPGHVVREVEVHRRSLARLEPLIGEERYTELLEAADRASLEMRGRTFWNLSSTSAGGGVAEMLQVLIGYSLDAELDVRWLVIAGDPEFFGITKRIHNRLHGAEGAPGPLGPDEAAHYAAVTSANAASALGRIRAGDVVLLHDPQTAGMAAALRQAGARVVWRCHVGRDTSNAWTDEAWSFLAPFLADCEAYIFSLRSYVPAFLEASPVHVIPPSIDPFSPKNEELSPAAVAAILDAIGVVPGGGRASDASFHRLDGTPGVVGRRATLVFEGDPIGPADRLVVQVSRWDRLKDMAGVMAGFVERVGQPEARLALVGPATAEVSDDPEGHEVYLECVGAWEALAPAERRRVTLVTLPMDDLEENAAMVNAIQRQATVVVQKSLFEGFGLTVAEAMWKARTVVASKVGGITEQVAPGTGVLLDDPSDLTAFGDAVSGLLADPARTDELGRRARQHVLDGFVGDRHLVRYAGLLESLSLA